MPDTILPGGGFTRAMPVIKPGPAAGNARGVSYERTHPAYDSMLPQYLMNRDLYEGGRCMDGPAAARRYLTRHSFEKPEQFDIRLKRAAYRNYAAPTVDLFASSIMDGVRREGLSDIAALQPLLKDCDRQGSAPDRFFKSVCTAAAAIGAEFVLVDMPRAKERAETMAEACAQGLFPYFTRIPAQDVIAWDFDEDGSLDWAVVRSEREESAGPFSGYETVKSVTLWKKDGWERFTSSGGKGFVRQGGGELDLGLVPLVPFLYEPASPMTGKSVIDDVASLVLRVFNQDSELDKMLFDAALPILAGFGLRAEDAEGAYKATSNIWTFSNPDIRLEYVEPSSTSFNAKRQQILDDMESIREISLRQTKPRGAQVESAESKRLDSVQLTSQLADFARNAAACERRCWEIAGRFAGMDVADLAQITVAYNESFDPHRIREELSQRFLELRRNGDISRETLWRQLGLDDEAVLLETERLANEGQGRTADSREDTARV